MVRVIAHTRITRIMLLLQHRKSSALKPGRWIVVFGWTRKTHRAKVEGHALLSHQHAIADKTGELPSHQHAVAATTED